MLEDKVKEQIEADLSDSCDSHGDGSNFDINNETDILNEIHLRKMERLRAL